MLLTFGAYVNHFGDKMWAPVHVACDHGYTGVVTSLIDGAADFETPVEGGATALYIAAYAGHADIVHLLVRSGAEVRCFPKCHGLDHLRNFQWVPLTMSSATMSIRLFERKFLHQNFEYNCSLVVNYTIEMH